MHKNVQTNPEKSKRFTQHSCCSMLTQEHFLKAIRGNGYRFCPQRWDVPYRKPSCLLWEALVCEKHIVGSRVPAKPSRFEHWGAREGFLPIDPCPSSLRSCGRTRRTSNTKTQDLYWFGPPLWCNTLLQCVVVDCVLGWWRTIQGEERPPEVEVFLCSVCG